MPFAAVVLLAALSVAPPQGLSGDVLGLVRTESGRPVAGARVRFTPDGADGLDWLAWLGPTPPTIEGRTDEQGRFRFRAPLTTGSLIVEHEDGLGAFAGGASTGAAMPIEVRALGAITATGGGVLTAEVRALRDERPSVALGRYSGEAIRLPAGRYLLLVERDGRRAERTAVVRAGRTATVEPPSDAGPALVVRDAPVRVESGRWPGTELRGPDGRLPALAAPDVIRVTFRDESGAVRIAEAWWSAGAVGIPVAPPAGAWRRVRVVDVDGRDLPGAEVVTAIASPGRARIVARSPAGADGGVALDVPVDPTHVAERVVFVARAPGRATRLLGAADVESPVVLPPARPARFRLEGSEGEPAAGAVVLARSSDDPLLDRRLASDSRGVVVLPDVSGGPCVVEIRPIDHLPRTGEVVWSRPDALPVVLLERGKAIEGVARLTDDRPAAGIDVELRDPSGTLGIAPRTVATDDDGRFRFRGVPDGTFTLFAQGLVDGVTWSCKVRGVQPGPDEWRIELRNEDPEAPGPRRRDG